MNGKPPHRTPRTHTMVISIPINTETLTDLNYDAISQALNVALMVSRAALDGVVCDEIQVEMVEAHE